MVVRGGRLAVGHAISLARRLTLDPWGLPDSGVTRVLVDVAAACVNSWDIRRSLRLGGRASFAAVQTRLVNSDLRARLLYIRLLLAKLHHR